jgi:hypothetical protein
MSASANVARSTFRKELGDAAPDYMRQLVLQATIDLSRRLASNGLLTG